jgi:hypothetical protein
MAIHYPFRALALRENLRDWRPRKRAKLRSLSFGISHSAGQDLPEFLAGGMISPELASRISRWRFLSRARR